jgi:hypothetical protein
MKLSFLKKTKKISKAKKIIKRIRIKFDIKKKLLTVKSPKKLHYKNYFK